MTVTAYDIVEAALRTPYNHDDTETGYGSPAAVSPPRGGPPEPATVFRGSRHDPAVTGFTVGDSWRSAEPVRFESECPSGQKVLLRHLTALDAIEYDLAEDVDVFSRRLQSGGGGDGAAGDPFWKLMRRVDDRLVFMGLLNRLCLAMIVAPQVVDDGLVVVTDTDGPLASGTPHKGQHIVGLAQLPAGDERRASLPPLPSDATYLSSIDFGDKMHIFREFDRPLATITPFR